MQLIIAYVKLFADRKGDNEHHENEVDGDDVTKSMKEHGVRHLQRGLSYFPLQLLFEEISSSPDNTSVMFM